MQFSITVPGLFFYPAVTQEWHRKLTPEDMLRVARRADELGYDYLSVPEHIIVPNEIAENLGGRYAHALTSLAFFAGVTKRIRFVTGILVLPYYDPLILAKTVSTLDFLTQGRVTLGVGAGYLAREFAILKVPLHERGARCDEYLMAMKELWTSPNPSFKGRFVQFENVVFDPKPVQQPPPIWIGGYARAVLRRAVELGDGWSPYQVPFDEMPACLEYIRGQPAYQKRTRPFDVLYAITPMLHDRLTHRVVDAGRKPMSRDEIIHQAGVLREMGVTQTGAVLGRSNSLEEFLERLQSFAEDVMPFCRGA